MASSEANENTESSVSDCRSLLTLLQFSDSAFPTGGFSHSCGLEAWHQNQTAPISRRENLECFVLCCLENCGSFSLPFLNEAFNNFQNGSRLQELDTLFNVCNANHISKKASTRQGRSFLDIVSKMYSSVAGLKKDLAYCNYPVVMGAVCGIIGLDQLSVQTMFTFSVLRNALASAVRLGQIGPIEAQMIQKDLTSHVTGIVDRYKFQKTEEASLIYPCLDIVQNSHDTMFCKLFYS